tara:strand:- start:295 stop:588 length:294 start_codon:yes stop_codon:yes gene_type:complete
MIKKLMQLVFMDKSGRAAAKRLRESQAQIARAEAVAVPDEQEDEQEEAREPASDREILLEQAMDLYRQRRAEYEQLDESVRAKMTKLADDQFNKKDS